MNNISLSRRLKNRFRKGREFLCFSGPKPLAPAKWENTQRVRSFQNRPRDMHTCPFWFYISTPGTNLNTIPCVLCSPMTQGSYSSVCELCSFLSESYCNGTTCASSGHFQGEPQTVALCLPPHPGELLLWAVVLKPAQALANRKDFIKYRAFHLTGRVGLRSEFLTRSRARLVLVVHESQVEKQFSKT